MSVFPSPQDSEVQKLRRALGDMAALSSLPALWLNADARGICDSLAAALVRVLDLDGVRVVMSGMDTVQQTAPSRNAEELAAQLERTFPGGECEGRDVRELEDGSRALCTRLGVTLDARLYAVARRTGFPSAAERLAVVSTANQAAVALRRADVEAQLRTQTEALNRERDAVAALNRSLSLERDKMRLLFDQAPGFMAMLRGPDHVFDLCNESYYRLVGRRDLIGRTVRDGFPELDGQGFFELLDEVYSTGRPHVAMAAPVDLRRNGDAPLERLYVDFIYQPVFDVDGRVSGVFAEGHDVTDQVLAAEHRQLLVNELNHRVKNTLATVQSLAHQTLRGAVSLAEAKSTLTSRLVSLSRAHDVLTRENWAGAEAGEIVAEAMRAHHEPQRMRVSARGPRVKLSARSALALSMALHELATNAAKYGALSNDEGKVSIRWEQDGSGHIRLEWRERGGPRVSRPPGRQGFGSRLLKAGLAAELGAPAELDYRAEGLICRLRAPLIAPPDHNRAAHAASEPVLTTAGPG